MLATLLLVALLLLPAIPVSPTPAIEIDPSVASRVRHKDYTIYVYADYDNSYCPENGSVNKILGDYLDLAFQIHSDSLLRFVGEFGHQYDRLILLKFVKTSNIDEAALIIRVKDTSPAVGQTLSTNYRGRYYGLIEYNCSLAYFRPNVALDTVLHELYHSLGIGHTTEEPPDKVVDLLYSELMFGAVDLGMTNYVYPSTLDIHALWTLWFTDSYKSTTSPVVFRTNLPYLMVEPYNVSLTRLVEQSREQEGRIRSLMGTVYDLRNDIMTLRDRVTKYEYEVRGLSAENEALRNETARLNMLVGDLSGRLEEREKAVAKLNEELSGANARISSLESQVNALESFKSSLESENELLRARIDSLRWILLVLVVTFVCTATSLAVVWRTRKK
jgi:regulator of replication initiation timing